MIGAFFKIMHWPGAAIMIDVSLVVIVITYIVRFINKKTKTVLDIFKVLLVVSKVIETVLILAHLVRRDLLIVSDLVGWFLILFFVMEEYKKGVAEKISRMPKP